MLLEFLLSQFFLSKADFQKKHCFKYFFRETAKKSSAINGRAIKALLPLLEHPLEDLFCYFIFSLFTFFIFI